MSTESTGGYGEFSTFESKDGFNELAQPDVETIKQVFIGYVTERQAIFNNCLESIVPFGCMSFDATYHIQKRGKRHVLFGTVI